MKRQEELPPLRQGAVIRVADYNLQRSHLSLGYLTPAAFEAYLIATGDQLHNPDQLGQPPVAIPASLGAKHPGFQSPLDQHLVADQQRSTSA